MEMSLTVKMTAILIGLILILNSNVDRAGVGADIPAVKFACNTLIYLRCSDPNGLVPTWFRNGRAIVGDDYSYIKNENTGAVTGTALLSGSDLCGSTSDIYCAIHNRYLHNISLTVEGRLPSPEDIRINKLGNVSDIEWKPPYSAMNTNSSFIYVDPRVTQYSVYTLGNYMDKVNVTETSFRRNTTEDHSCLLYSVTAWNSGGEGNMSERVYLPLVPRSIVAEDVNLTTESDGLHITFLVIEPCAKRVPNSFYVTWMTTDGVNLTTVRHHQPGHPVDIRLPKYVDKCNLNILRISAENSAGMSSPTEIPVGCQTTGNSTATTPTTTTPTITTPTTTSDATPTDRNPQGDNSTIYITFEVAVGVVVVIVAAVALLLFINKYKRTTKGGSSEENVYVCSPVYLPDSHPGPKREDKPLEIAADCGGEIETTGQIPARTSTTYAAVDPIKPPCPVLPTDFSVEYSNIDQKQSANQDSLNCHLLSTEGSSIGLCASSQYECLTVQPDFELLEPSTNVEETTLEEVVSVEFPSNMFVPCTQLFSELQRFYKRSTQLQTSGHIYADVKALPVKTKPPAQDDRVQYSTILPLPVFNTPSVDPPLPAKRQELGEMLGMDEDVLDKISPTSGMMIVEGKLAGSPYLEYMIDGKEKKSRINT